MIELLDYILDIDNNFWIVEKITKDNYYGFLIYKVDKNGTRYNPITNLTYSKQINGRLLPIPKYKRIFKPRDCYRKYLDEIPIIWRKYIECLNQIGINDIGIYGSFLIGFPVIKDIDFIIYGYDNYLRYKKNYKYIKNYIGASSITNNHINMQYNKHKDIYSSKCDLKKIISRNWSGVELKNGILSTPRFLLKEQISPIKRGIDDIRVVEIIESDLSDFLPRRSRCILNGEVYEIYTSLWKYQSFAKVHDKIELFANYDDENHVIILDNYNYYIKYL